MTRSGAERKAIIHYSRPGKGESLYVENLVQDDNVRLDTCSMLEPNFALRWSIQSWQQNGYLGEGQIIHTVRKHHFYQEWFAVMELFDAAGQRLGCYCDVLTPIIKRDGEYYLEDLFLDVWISADGQFKELDWDEFELAVMQGLVQPEIQQKAIQTQRRMVDEIQARIFPDLYLPKEVIH